MESYSQEIQDMKLTLQSLQITDPNMGKQNFHIQSLASETCLDSLDNSMVLEEMMNKKTSEKNSLEDSEISFQHKVENEKTEKYNTAVEIIEALPSTILNSQWKEELRHVQSAKEAKEEIEEVQRDDRSPSRSISSVSEPTNEAVEHLLRVISDPNLDLRIEDIEDPQSVGTVTEADEAQSKEIHTECNEEFAQASTLIEEVTRDEQ